ncbi:MAG: ABC transporter ATP-binding protein [Planctomycetota bacterium]
MNESTNNASGTTPALEVSGLRFRYDDGPWVIDLDQLTLGPAEQILLTGGSGFGKSTLLQLIAGLLDPSEGTIRVAGEDMHRRRGASRDIYRGRNIGMIFQTFNLLPGFSALENVMLALMVSDRPKSEHRNHAGALLAELGIDDPGTSPDRMSVGQQQRVAVARAIACEPPLVLADEPTASLDPDNTQAAMDMIQRTCEAHGAALVCTSHDPVLEGRFTRIESLVKSLVGVPL